MQVKQIQSVEECPEVVNLFNEYRVFYKKDSDLEGAKEFLTARLKNKESIVLVAFHEDKPQGFTQLYPSFSSVSMQPLYVLNDLFVREESRGLGIGAALLAAAEEMGRSQDWKGMVLETAADNPARKLYEREGWSLDEEYKHYGKYF